MVWTEWTPSLLNWNSCITSVYLWLDSAKCWAASLRCQEAPSIFKAQRETRRPLIVGCLYSGVHGIFKDTLKWKAVNKMRTRHPFFKPRADASWMGCDGRLDPGPNWDLTQTTILDINNHRPGRYVLTAFQVGWNHIPSVLMRSAGAIFVSAQMWLLLSRSLLCPAAFSHPLLQGSKELQSPQQTLICKSALGHFLIWLVPTTHPLLLTTLFC